MQPASPEGYTLRAVSEINRKQFQQAEEDIRKAIAVAPQSHLGYVQLGNLRFVQKQYGEAGKAYQDALDRDPNSTDALRGLMNTYLAQNQVDKALAAANAQIAKSPANGSFYYLLGSVLFRENAGDPWHASFVAFLFHSWRGRTGGSGARARASVSGQSRCAHGLRDLGLESDEGDIRNETPHPYTPYIAS